MRSVQLPLITPTLFFLAIINLTDSFTDSFGIVDIMTQGGPARATELMVYKIYFDGFKGLDYSGAGSGFETLLRISGPGTKFIPGHGSVVGREAVAAHRDMIVDVVDRVKKMIAEGKTNKEIAVVLNLSVYTVDAHRGRIMEKLNVHNVNELVRFAIRNGLID